MLLSPCPLDAGPRTLPGQHRMEIDWCLENVIMLLCAAVGATGSVGLLDWHINAGGGRGHVPCVSSIFALYVIIVFVCYDRRRRGYRHRHPPPSLKNYSACGSGRVALTTVAGPGAA